MEGTNKDHENGEAMGLVGVRLTVMLGQGGFTWVRDFMPFAADQSGVRDRRRTSSNCFPKTRGRRLLT